MKISYDPKCEELARYFLEDEWEVQHDAALTSELAGAIQRTIEDWMDERLGTEPPDEGEDDSGQGEEEPRST